MESKRPAGIERKALIALIHTIENPQDYTASAVDVAFDALRIQTIEQDTIKAVAIELMEQKCNKMLDGFSPLNDKLEIPYSHLLTETEVKAILKSAFDEWLSKRDDQSIDVWSYAIGGG